MSSSAEVRSEITEIQSEDSRIEIYLFNPFTSTSKRHTSDDLIVVCAGNCRFAIKIGDAYIVLDKSPDGVIVNDVVVDAKPKSIAASEITDISDWDFVDQPFLNIGGVTFLVWESLTGNVNVL